MSATTTRRAPALLIACSVAWVLILVLDLWVAIDPILGNASGADTENLDVFTPSSASSGWTLGVAVSLAAALGVAVGLWLLAGAAQAAVLTLEVGGALSVLGQALDGHAEALATMVLFAVGAALLFTAPVRGRLRRRDAE